MGVQITKSIASLSGKLKHADLSATMRAVSKTLVSNAVKKINAGVSPENAPLTQAVKGGDKTLRDNGTLMASIAPQHGKNWAAAQTNKKQAKLLQEGGTITGKGKGLWIPAGAQTRALMRKYNAQTPAALITAMKGAGYRFWRQGNAFFTSKKGAKKTTEPIMLFVIKQSVKIPARPFLYISDDEGVKITKTVKSAIHDALKEGQ